MSAEQKTKALFESMPIGGLGWVDAKRASQLERLGLGTVGDLLTHYPRRYEDRRQFDRFPTEESDSPVCVCGIVKSASLKRFGGWRKMFEIVIEAPDAHALSGSLVCRWFNLHYIQKMIATGQRIVVFGRPRLRKDRICIEHPDFEIIEDDAEELIHLKRITPIYPATEGLSQRVLRSILHRCIQEMRDDEIVTPLPANLDGNSRAAALRAIHFPPDKDALERARRHLVLTEFFAMQLTIGARRAESRAAAGEAHCGPGDLVGKFHATLPFSLTGAQKRALGEIRGDLASQHRMNRLLHGDVGSGKTLVALSAMLLAIEAGHQAALMAPTQILAEQHYLVARGWLAPLGIRIALRTGARKDESALPLFAGATGGTPGPLSGDEPQIVVGTHALLYEGFSFSRLGLVVIDEQHKFGVLQRARLIAQATAPDVLVMTATPIPRTLTMTIYGDLDVSTLDEMPANRGRIVTLAREPSKLPKIVEFIREQLAAGRQAYIVYPIIEESQTLEVKAATQEFTKWQELLKPMRCDLLHGRIPPDEKERVMQRFRAGDTQVLVATSVIEVGVDVPNVNVILIENAERFGLAQLHQLRGRIGRGEHKSWCILLTGQSSAEALEKLTILEKTSDGFEIADADLRLRGPGDLLGTAQSGLPPLKLGDLLADAELMRLARGAATEIFRHDPQLDKPEHFAFRSLVAGGRRSVLSQVS